MLIVLYFAITLSFDLVNQLKTASKEFDLKEKQAESATAVIILLNMSTKNVFFLNKAPVRLIANV